YLLSFPNSLATRDLHPFPTRRSSDLKIATETARLLGRPRNFAPDEIAANANYLGEGYGILGPPEREAIDLFARLEGVLLDPVYTDRKSTRLNSSHVAISYAVFCLKKK